jgi:hypothetical protein
VIPGENEEEKDILLNGRNIIDMLPRKKSTKPHEVSTEPELPGVRMMYYQIEEKVVGLTRTDICQGFASDTVVFEDSQQPPEEVAVPGDSLQIPSEEDTSVDDNLPAESPLVKTSQTSCQTTIPPSPRLGRFPSSSSTPGESPRHSSVAESLLAMKKNGKTLTRYSKSLRS